VKLKLAVAGAAAVLLAIPVVVLATTNEHLEGADFQKWVSTGAQQTDTKSWTAVPGLTITPPVVHGPVAVSAQMTQGRAKFRVVAALASGPAVALPGKVEFDAPASNAFTFFNVGNCVPVTVQWKKVGKPKAALAKASMHAIWGNGCG